MDANSSPSRVRTLLVDGRPVDHPTARQRGIGRYVTGLLAGLHEIGAPVVALHGSDLEAEVLAEAIPGLRLQRWSPEVIREHAAPGTWYVATQLMLHPIPLDPIPSIITRARLPVAAVMYDVIPYRFPERYQVEPSARRQAQLRKPLANTVDAMLAISRFSADTAIDELGYPRSRMAVIGAGVDQQFQPPTVRPLPRADRVLPRHVGRYVVSVTGGDERKNTEGLLRGWAKVDPMIREGRHLVVATAASPDVLRRWAGWADECGIGDEVVFTGSVTDDEMVSILQGAELAVMPSIEEGFGLPVVEAAACGCPVVCSDVSSLPEVLEEPAAEFDPFDHDSIARAIERALIDEAHRQVLRAAGRRSVERWTWSRTAADTIAALDALGPRWPQRIRRPARRLAVATPGGTSGSGIGAYDDSLLEALERQVGDGTATSIDVFVDTSSDPEPVVPAPSGRRHPVRALGRFAKPWDYDHVVIALGSSPHHIASLDVATATLATTSPAHLWLHEASLVGVHVGLAHRSGSEGWARQYVGDLLARNEAPDLVAELTDDLMFDAPALDARGVTLLAEALHAARSVIVSSEAAAATVRRIDPDGAPLLVLPLAFPPVVECVAGAIRGDLVAVGWLADNKAPEIALDALALLDPAATLTFVGPADERVAAEVVRLAAELGVSDRVSMTGRLDPDEFRRRVARARVGVQLRRDDRGEMSAAITDLLAAGVPVVTTLATAGAPTEAVSLVGLDAAAIAAALGPLIDDDDVWQRASAAATTTASSWTFDDVAGALLEWLDLADELPRGSTERRGPSVVADR